MPSFEVDGKTYDSIEALPPDVRRAMESQGLIPTQEAAPAEEKPEKLAPTQETIGESATPRTRQTLLNGVPLEPERKKRRWWQRG